MDSGFQEFFNLVSASIFDFQKSYQGQVVKWIFIIYSLIFLVSIGILVFKLPSIWEYSLYGGKKKDKGAGKGIPEVGLPRTPWEKINAKLNSVNPNDWKIAVIEADKMLDSALKAAKVAGATMGDRLKNMVSGDVGGKLEEIWEAHKVRNSLVHNPEYELSSDEARKTVRALEEASKAVGE